MMSNKLVVEKMQLEVAMFEDALKAISDYAKELGFKFDDKKLENETLEKIYRKHTFGDADFTIIHSSVLLKYIDETINEISSPIIIIEDGEECEIEFYEVNEYEVDFTWVAMKG